MLLFKLYSNRKDSIAKELLHSDIRLLLTPSDRITPNHNSPF